MRYISLEKSYKYIIILFIIILAFSLNNFFWIKNNKLPPTGNCLQDLFPAINFYLDAIHNNITFKDLFNGVFKYPLISVFKYSLLDTSIFSNSSNYIRFQFPTYPPLVPLSYSLVYFLFGPNTRMELMVNILYLAVAMISIYGIGKKIFNEKVGLLAVFIFSSFPGIISLSRAMNVEFNLMCLITLTLFFLLRTDFFRNRKYSVLLGISLGLTALTKWAFPITMVGPFFLYLNQCHLFAVNKKNIPVSNSYIRINLLLSILISILISFFWYSVSVQGIIWRIKSGAGSTFSLEVPLIQKFSFYPLSIINTFISFFYFLLLILVGISFSYSIIKNRNRQPKIKSKLLYALFLVLWILIPYLVFSLILLYPQHIMPVLPAIAILISLGIFSFKNIIVRSILICLIILYGVGSYLHSFLYFGKLDLLYRLRLYLRPDLNFSLTIMTDNISRDAWQKHLFYPPDIRDWKFEEMLTFILRDAWQKHLFYPPDINDWKIEEILAFIKKDSHNIKFSPLILILSRESKFNCFGFQYYNLLRGYQLYIEPRGNDRSSAPPDPSKFDYVVIKTSLLFYNRMDETALSEIIELTPINEGHKIDEFKKAFFDKYKLIKEYLLPDNTKAKVYKLMSS